MGIVFASALPNKGLNMPEKGYVYILTNPSMPGLVKIGKTTRDVDQRANELYQTGVPEPFEVSHYVYSPDCNELEIMVHRALASSRVSTGREFFRDELARAGTVLDDCLREQVEEWLEEFIPDHTIVAYDAYVDIGALSHSALEKIYSSEVEYPDIPKIFYEVSGEDISEAITKTVNKAKERVAAYRAKQAEDKAKLKIVGEE